MKVVKAKAFEHLKHVDTFALMRLGERHRIRICGWVLCAERRSPVRIWAEFAGTRFDAIRFYRHDVLEVEGGAASDDQLPGFDLEIESRDGKGLVALYAENRKGEAALIWSRKVKPKDFEQGNLNPAPIFSGFDFIRDLALLPPGPPPPRRDHDQPPTVEWIIPDFTVGAGGHAAIFRILKGCEDLGWKTRLWILFSSRHGSPDAVRDVLRKHFQPIEPEVRFVTPAAVASIDGEIGFATDRWTAYFLRAASKVDRKYYLVQDYEPLFYPEGSSSLLAENTYSFPFIPFVSTPWLAERLARFGHESVTVFRYGVNREAFFRPSEPRRNERPRIAFYSRGSTERRAVDLGFIAFELLSARGVAFEVDFFGYDMTGISTSYPHRNHGVLNEAGLGDLFREVDLGMAFSATNPSIISGEMMACGLAVVELDRRNNRLSWPDAVMAWVAPDPTAIADRLEQLIVDREERERIAAAGYEYSETLSWEKAVQTVMEKLEADRARASC